MQGLLALLAFGLLIAVFVRTDMSVLLVAENSHSAKPMIYKFAGAWGNHEGSMLLWVTILAAGGRGRWRCSSGGWRARTLAATLGAQAADRARLLRLPAVRLQPVRAAQSRRRRTGNGLNPLLQDPGLAFHPPTLYIGYVGLSVAFSFAVGALVTRDVGPAFARAMRPWVLGAWIFLTLGITAGSYWAYYELGWGGWWFWDPVENAIADAVAGGDRVAPFGDGAGDARRLARVDDDARGGRVLDEHDRDVPGAIGHPDQRSRLRGRSRRAGRSSWRLLGDLYRRRAGAVRARVGTVRAGQRPSQLVSREGALVLNNLLLSVILGIVLIGTLYPLVARRRSGCSCRSARRSSTRRLVPVALALVAFDRGGAAAALAARRAERAG